MGDIKGWIILPTTALPAHMMGAIVRSTLAFKLRLGVRRVFMVVHCSKSEPVASSVLQRGRRGQHDFMARYALF